MQKQKITPEFKRWLGKTSKKYAKALGVLTREDPEELKKYEPEVKKIASWFKKHCKKKKYREGEK